MMNVFHIEPNGFTNTGFYVSKIVGSLSTFSEMNTRVMTSKKNGYNDIKVTAIFSSYNQKKKSIKLLFYILGMIRLILNPYPPKSIFHFHWLKLSMFDFLIVFILKIRGMIVVQTVHNLIPHEANILDKIFFPFIYGQMNGLIFHCRRSVETFNLQFGKKQNQFIIPHFGYSTVQEPVINQKSYNRILFFGAIRYYKGLDILLQSLMTIGDNAEWSLSVIGQPNIEMDPLKKLAEPFKDRIVWKMKWIDQDEIETIFNEHFIVAMPYRHIDSSGVVNLAMSYGRLVIGPDIGCIGDTIQNGINGLLFQQGNIEMFTSQLYQVLHEPESYVPMAKRAYQDMNNHYNLDSIATQHYQFYQTVLS